MPFLAGLSFGLSLIIAIGAQNLFVLRQGARGEHVFLVAAICAVSDLTLIVLGVAGVGAATDAVPWLLPAVRWAGALFLVGYGVLAARRALRPAPAPASAPAVESEPAPGVLSALAVSAPGTGTTLQAVRSSAVPTALTCLALTWLNPHVYLDTVFLLGSIAATHGDRNWEFAAGAMLGSIAWFFGLAYGARYLGRWLSGPTVARATDGVIAVVMIAIGVHLVL